MFADAYGQDWSAAEIRFRNEPLKDDCGNSHPNRIIDREWLCNNVEQQVRREANGPGRAIVIVPPLRTFLDETIDFFASLLMRVLLITRRFASLSPLHL